MTCSKDKLVAEYTKAAINQRFATQISRELRVPITNLGFSAHLLTRYTERLSREQIVRHAHLIEETSENFTTILDAVTEAILRNRIKTFSVHDFARIRAHLAPIKCYAAAIMNLLDHPELTNIQPKLNSLAAKIDTCSKDLAQSLETMLEPYVNELPDRKEIATATRPVSQSRRPGM